MQNNASADINKLISNVDNTSTTTEITNKEKSIDFTHVNSKPSSEDKVPVFTLDQNVVEASQTSVRPRSLLTRFEKSVMYTMFNHDEQDPKA